MMYIKLILLMALCLLSVSWAEAAPSSGEWVVNLLSYPTKAKAAGFITRLKKKDFTAEMVQANTHGTVRYQVRIAGLGSRTDAETMRVRLKQDTNIEDAHIHIIAPEHPSADVIMHPVAWSSHTPPTKKQVDGEPQVSAPAISPRDTGRNTGKITMSRQDSTRLVAAVEDFNFQDYAPAIEKLKRLYSRYPAHHELLRTYARALDESGQVALSVPIFRAWADHFPDDRAAQIGLATVLKKTGKTDESSRVLQRWMAAHPDDHNARIVLIDSLIRSKDYQAAKEMAGQSLRQHGVSAKMQSAVHYYLAYIARSEGDFHTSNAEAQASIQSDSGGVYAARSQMLLGVLQQSRIASAGERPSITVGGYYTSNAALLPESLRQSPLLRTDPAKPAADKALQTAINFGYRKDAWLASYRMDSTAYQDHPNLNLLVQRIGMTWAGSQVSITPHYDYLRLGQHFLYQGGGLDMIWSSDGLVLYYGGAFKAFNNHFGKINPQDLGRLSGFSHDVLMQYSMQGFTGSDTFSLGLTLHAEDTRGDVTHPKSDSYRQVGGLAGWSGVIHLPRSSLDIHTVLNFQGYYRAYLHADSTVLSAGITTKRKDHYLMGSLRFNGSPFTGLPVVVSAYGQWQKNFSNYDAGILKDMRSAQEFTEWRSGGSIQWIF